MLYSAVAGSFASLLALLTLIGGGGSTSVVTFMNKVPGYSELVTQTDPPVYVAYEVQAAPLLASGVAGSFRADYVGTIVIAVDRDQVDDVITGWDSLRNGQYMVCFDYSRVTDITFASIILAISEGLDGNGRGDKNAIRLLSDLYSQVRLSSGSLDHAPVAIVPDFIAAQQAMNGRNIEIVVPAEGTLSFYCGIMSVGELELPTVAAPDLVAAGFRLPDGTADQSLYPHNSVYSVATAASLDHQTALQVVRSIASFRRQVLGRRLYSPATGLENTIVYLTFILVLILWSGALYVRISDKAIRKRLFIISGLLLLWMLVRVLRLLIPDGTLDRSIWYLYYVPLVFAPLTLFSIGHKLTHNESMPVRAMRRLGLPISFALVSLVLTNDLHQMAFRFPRGMAGNNYDLYYSHGWVYYAVFGWSTLLVLVFLAMMLRQKKESVSNRAGPLLFIHGLGTIYFAGYAAGVPILRETEFSVVFGILSLLYLEVCFRNRLIPNNTLLGALLRSAGIEMFILSAGLTLEYSANLSSDLPEQALRVVEDLGPDESFPYGFYLPGDETVLYSVHRIGGGYAVFAHQLSEVLRLREHLAETSETIALQNRVLARTHMVRSEIAGLRAHQDLYAQVNSVLEERVFKLNTMVAALSFDDSTADDGATLGRLARVKVLVNYCKRRGHVALLEATDELCHTSSVALWLQESIWEAGKAGVEGLVSESADMELPASRAALLYDLFQDILEFLLQFNSSVIVANMSAIGSSLRLRIAIETELYQLKSCRELLEKRGIALSRNGGQWSVQDHDGGLLIVIDLPDGRRRDG